MKTLRLAMWSGPQRTGLLLMRAWGQRTDTAVWDEPFYAHYLRERRPESTATAGVLRRHEGDWPKIVERIAAPLAPPVPIVYMKLTARYLLPEVDRSWMSEVANCFLIRDPREMLALEIRRGRPPSVAQTGLPQQVEIFRRAAAATGQFPPVVDHADLLAHPRRTLRLLCEALGVFFTDSMLSWPAGARDTDGVWGAAAYASALSATRFDGAESAPETLAADYTGVFAECSEFYKLLHRHRLALAVVD